MFKTHQIQQGKKTVTALELTLFAFTTPKGTFTLSGTNTDGTDTWRNIDTGEFHEWSRKSVKSWFEQGKIHPVEKAITLTWLETNGNGTTIDYNAKTIHRHHKK